MFFFFKQIRKKYVSFQSSHSTFQFRAYIHMYNTSNRQFHCKTKQTALYHPRSKLSFSQMSTPCVNVTKDFLIRKATHQRTIVNYNFFAIHTYTCIIPTYIHTVTHLLLRERRSMAGLHYSPDFCAPSPSTFCLNPNKILRDNNPRTRETRSKDTHMYRLQCTNSKSRLN